MLGQQWLQFIDAQFREFFDHQIHRATLQNRHRQVERRELRRLFDIVSLQDAQARDRPRALHHLRVVSATAGVEDVDARAGLEAQNAQQMVRFLWREFDRLCVAA